MSWDVMNEFIEGIYLDKFKLLVKDVYIYKVDNTIDLNNYQDYEIIHGKIKYVYHVYEMDDWNRTRSSDTVKETPNGIWIIGNEPIKGLSEYRYLGE